MKNSKKALLVGLGATAAIVAIAAAMAFEEEAVDKIGSYLNRQRMKGFVRDHLKGSQKILKAIEDLTTMKSTDFYVLWTRQAIGRIQHWIYYPT